MPPHLIPQNEDQIDYSFRKCWSYLDEFEMSSKLSDLKHAE